MTQMSAGLCVLSCVIHGVSACAFAKSGMDLPNDHTHRHLFQGSTYPVLPGPVTTRNNAFVTEDLLKPLRVLTGNDDTLASNLADFATDTGDDLCYWAFQGLPPPRGGPTLLHPNRGYWDVSDGHNDQDIEWVQAYGEVAAARLHSRIRKDGPLVGAMCAMGSHLTARRCENGASRKEKCIPAITNSSIHWPMAVSMWKVGHPELEAAVTDWRGNGQTGHVPNIEWDAHIPYIPTAAARPWNGTMPMPGELNPHSMPNDYPVSLGVGWGSPKISKVVKCSEIPSKFLYNIDELFYCDSMSNATMPISNADEAYQTWSSLQGVWPPTKECKDDQPALDQVLKTLHMDALVGNNCSVAFGYLQQFLPGFDCDNSDTQPTIRHMCCSVCENQPIPDVPAPAPPAPAQQCSVCTHVYNADRDGGGKTFEDLPDDWVCPRCGAKKGAYSQTVAGDWAHDDQVTVEIP